MLTVYGQLMINYTASFCAKNFRKKRFQKSIHSICGKRCSLQIWLTFKYATNMKVTKFWLYMYILPAEIVRNAVKIWFDCVQEDCWRKLCSIKFYEKMCKLVTWGAWGQLYYILGWGDLHNQPSTTKNQKVVFRRMIMKGTLTSLLTIQNCFLFLCFNWIDMHTYVFE